MSFRPSIPQSCSFPSSSVVPLLGLRVLRLRDVVSPGGEVDLLVAVLALQLAGAAVNLEKRRKKELISLPVQQAYFDPSGYSNKQINILFQTIYAYCTALGLTILLYSTVCFKKALPAHLDLDPSDLWLPVPVHRLVDRLVVGVLGEGHGEGQGGGQAARQDGEEALKSD